MSACEIIKNRGHGTLRHLLSSQVGTRFRGPCRRVTVDRVNAYTRAAHRVVAMSRSRGERDHRNRPGRGPSWFRGYTQRCHDFPKPKTPTTRPLTEGARSALNRTQAGDRGGYCRCTSCSFCMCENRGSTFYFEIGGPLFRDTITTTNTFEQSPNLYTSHSRDGHI